MEGATTIRGTTLMKNIEFKAELRDIALARATCHALRARHAAMLLQTDEFVAVPSGRLKRRTERDAVPGEAADALTAARVSWIWYERSDTVGARPSVWTRLDDEQVLARWPGLDLAPTKVVVKRRELWMLENVRIHLDTVAGLSNYLELEGIVGAADDETETRMKVETLVEKFRPALGEAVSGSYADL